MDAIVKIIVNVNLKYFERKMIVKRFNEKHFKFNGIIL